MNYAIMPEKLYNIIDKDIIFIDIRDSYQFNNLHIKNFINLDPSTLDSYPLDKSKPICLICYSGKLTKSICQDLRNKGYDAYYVEGGFSAFLNLDNKQYY